MLAIHVDTHNPSLAPKWHVMVDPTTTGRHDLVRFVKWNAGSREFDKTAQWTAGRWDPHRWVPQSPEVPAKLLKKVETWMRKSAEMHETWMRKSAEMHRRLLDHKQRKS